MAVAKATNSSAISVPVAGFVLCQKLFVQMDTGATLCFLGMRVALGLELAPGEECVCCVLLDEDIFFPVVEKCAPCMSGGVGLGHMAAF